MWSAHVHEIDRMSQLRVIAVMQGSMAHKIKSLLGYCDWLCLILIELLYSISMIIRIDS